MLTQYKPEALLPRDIWYIIFVDYLNAQKDSNGTAFPLACKYFNGLLKDLIKEFLPFYLDHDFKLFNLGFIKEIYALLGVTLPSTATLEEFVPKFIASEMIIGETFQEAETKAYELLSNFYRLTDEFNIRITKALSTVDAKQYNKKVYALTNGQRGQIGYNLYDWLDAYCSIGNFRQIISMLEKIYDAPDLGTERLNWPLFLCDMKALKQLTDTISFNEPDPGNTLGQLKLAVEASDVQAIEASHFAQQRKEIRFSLNAPIVIRTLKNFNYDDIFTSIRPEILKLLIQIAGPGLVQLALLERLLRVKRFELIPLIDATLNHQNIIDIKMKHELDSLFFHVINQSEAIEAILAHPGLRAILMHSDSFGYWAKSSNRRDLLMQYISHKLTFHLNLFLGDSYQAILKWAIANQDEPFIENYLKFADDSSARTVVAIFAKCAANALFLQVVKRLPEVLRAHYMLAYSSSQKPTVEIPVEAAQPAIGMLTRYRTRLLKDSEKRTDNEGPEQEKKPEKKRKKK